MSSRDPRSLIATLPRSGPPCSGPRSLRTAATWPRTAPKRTEARRTSGGRRSPSSDPIRHGSYRDLCTNEVCNGTQKGTWFVPKKDQTGTWSVVQNMSLKRSFVRRCLRTRLHLLTRLTFQLTRHAGDMKRLRGAYPNKYGQTFSTTPQHELTQLTVYIFLLGANIKQWKQAHMQIHGEVKLTHFAYASATAQKCLRNLTQFRFLLTHSLLMNMSLLNMNT